MFPDLGCPGLGCPGLGCPGLGCPGLGWQETKRKYGYRSKKAIRKT